MQSYSEVAGYLTNKADKLNANQAILLTEFIIKEVVNNIPDEFNQDEFGNPMPLLIDLHQELLKPSLNLENIRLIAGQLDEILENDGTAFDCLTLSLASDYLELHQMANATHQHLISEIIMGIVLTYLDFLDYQASFDEIELDNWANYPMIKQGIFVLDDYLNQL